ncbi:MAG: YlxR family protein [Firmicutes bacterium]|nr:YlxR family protein [Bacillota bacterium]
MKSKKIPMRRCVGCMESKPKKELIRIVNDKEGGLNLDVTGKAQGRGVYLCPDTSCFNNARKKNAISRSLGITITPEKLDAIFEELKKYEKE